VTPVLPTPVRLDSAEARPNNRGVRGAELHARVSSDRAAFPNATLCMIARWLTVASRGWASEPPMGAALMVGTNPSSTRRATGETLTSPGDPAAQLAVVVLELDFCVLDRAGTRPALNDTSQMDDEEG
jgi:hypothetical protein